MNAEEITELVLQIINNVSYNFFIDIEGKSFDMLNKLIFVNKDIVNTSLMQKLLSVNGEVIFSNNLLALASLFLFGILLWYGTRFMLSYHLGIETVQKPFQFISRAIIFGTFTFFSLDICSGIIDLNFKCTEYILNIPYKSPEIAEELGTETIGFTTLKKYMDKENVFATDNEENFNIFSLDGIMRGFINFGVITLIITYSLRYILLKVLVLLSPFAFICMIDKSGENLFKSFMKAFMALVFMQTFIALILIIPIALINQLKMDSDIYLLNKIFLAGSIYALYKSNDFVKELMGGVGITANIYNGINMIRNMVRK